MSKIIVSLTTTANRITLCRSTLFSLVTQSILPDKIIVNLSKEPYLRDDGIVESNIFDLLTKGIAEQYRNTIVLSWVDNTGPYRKLIPTLKESEDFDVIITADDDIFYGKGWLEILLSNFDPAAKTIHAGRVRKKNRHILGGYTGYLYWPIIREEVTLSTDWIVTFGGGAVLSRSWFSDDIVYDKSYIRVAPTADDLWFSKICQLSNLKVKVIPEALSSLNFFEHDDGLVNHNFPVSKGFFYKVLNRLLLYPLNYFRVFKIGNDKSYDLIEEHFDCKA